MRYLLRIPLLFLVNCAVQPKVETTPLNYTYLPAYLELDSVRLAVNSEEFTYNKVAPEFDPVPIFSGSRLQYKDQVTPLLPGLLVCEKDYVTCLINSSRVRRLEEENRILEQLRKDLYKGSVEAEKTYQQRIVDLTKSNERTWLEKNAFYLGVAAGATAVILTGASVQLSN